MAKKAYLAVTGSIFALIAAVHLLRLAYQWPVQIDTWTIPTWLSWFGMLVAGVLSVWAFRVLSD